MTTDLVLQDLRRSYANLLHVVVHDGQVSTARDLPVYELTGVRLTFPDALAPLLPVGVGRGINLRLAAVEALQVIAGESRPDLIRVAAPSFVDVLVDPSDLDYGAYGPRLGCALGDCLELLRRDPGTRQAVAAIWRPDDLEHVGDKPCTVFLQFLIRETVMITGKDVSIEPALELYVHMRSQDVWLGVPYDVFTFSQLQHTMARELHLPAGRYVHHTTSLHLYQRDLPLARHVLDKAMELDAQDLWDEAAPDDLPLGVVTVPGESATGFEVASYLLDDGDPRRVRQASNAERSVNTWYAQRLADVNARWTM